MSFFSDLAYGAYVGPLPMIAVIGFVTYALILSASILASGKRWSRRIRRVPVSVHRGVGIVAVLFATLHLLMGVSLYV